MGERIGGLLSHFSDMLELFEPTRPWRRQTRSLPTLSPSSHAPSQQNVRQHASPSPSPSIPSSHDKACFMTHSLDAEEKTRAMLLVLLLVLLPVLLIVLLVLASLPPLRAFCSCAATPGLCEVVIYATLIPSPPLRCLISLLHLSSLPPSSPDTSKPPSPLQSHV
eukprot:1926448-Rhodomonas_salina.1